MSQEPIEVTLARIEERLIRALADRIEDRSRLDGHSKRLGSLERWRATLVGAWAVLAAVSGYAAQKLFHL